MNERHVLCQIADVAMPDVFSIVKLQEPLSLEIFDLISRTRLGAAEDFIRPLLESDNNLAKHRIENVRRYDL